MSDRLPILRVARIPVSWRVLVNLLRDGTRHALTTEGLPPDAEFHHAYADWERNCFWLVVSSASFAPVPEACIPPTLRVKLTLEGFEPDADPPLDRPEVAVRWEAIEAGSFLFG